MVRQSSSNCSKHSQIRSTLRHLVFLAFLFHSLCIFAQQRSIVSVYDVAHSVLGSIASVSDSDIAEDGQLLRSSDLLDDQQLKVAGIEAFYVVKPADGKGFVIVSADVRMRKVLGFSYTGSFDGENMPIQIKSWLHQYTDELLSMENVCNPTQAAPTDNGEEPVIASLPVRTGGVAPLLGDLQWNQTAPYNNMCPIDTDGERSVTGCVATAMAQVMKYHSYPVSGSGSVSYTTSTNKLSVSVTFGEAYDWNNMLDSYSGSYTTTQADAVAKLMYHCGASTLMDYTSSSSGTQQDKIMNALYNYFGYDSDMAHVEKENYTEEQWNTLILTELNAGRPINYAGSQGLSGHSFVFDGYEMRDGISIPYYHVNWGWAGRCDGYYLTSGLAPSSPGVGGGYGDYTQRQQMVIRIQPEDGTVSTPVFDGSFTSSQTIFHYGDNNSFTVSMRAYNRSCRAFTGTMKLVAIASDGREISLFTHSQTSSVARSGSCSVNTTITLPSTMTVGTYKLEWRCYSTGKSDYNQIGFPADCTFIVYEESPQLVATVVGDASMIRPTEQYVLSLDVKNTGSMTYEGKIIAKIHQSVGDVTLESEACHIEAGATENVSISGWLRTMAPGSATITFENEIDSQPINNMSGTALTVNATAEVATADVSVYSMKAFDYSSDHRTITIYSYNFMNNSPVNFIGDYQLVLMDTQNNIIRRVGNADGNTGDGLGQGSYYVFARSFAFEFPSDIPNGNYRLGTYATQRNSGIWTLAKEFYSSAIQYVDVEVQTSSVIISGLTFVRNPYVPGVPVTSITLSSSSESLTVGATKSLTATVTPSNATNKDVSWTSSETSVATVSSSGLVTAIAAGTATITCTAADGSGKSATCAITVTSNSSDRNNVVVSNTAEATYSFSASGTYEWEWDRSYSRLRSTNYNVHGSTSQTTMSITTTQTTDFSFSYAVSSESGYDKLTITLDGSAIVDAISGTTSSSYSGSLSSGSHTLVFKYVKDGSVNSNDDRAYLSNMKFLAATIPVTDISLSSTSCTLQEGATTTLTPTITPANATNQDVTWTSSNTSVATVSSSGLVTAVAVGTATITCTAADGSGKYATCEVTVIEPIIPGDVNADKEVDVSDIAITVEHILGHSPNNFVFEAADLDSDNTVDVADLSLMANIIMYGSTTPASSAKRMVGADTTPYIYTIGEGQNVSLWIDDAGPGLSNIQFDINLPAGVSLMEAIPSGMMPTHSVSTSLLDDGRVRVVCFAFDNSLLMPDESGVIQMSFSGQTEGSTPQIVNVIASTPYGQKLTLDSISDLHDTSLRELTNGRDNLEIYAVDGRRRQSLDRGMNIVRMPDGSFKKIWNKQ